jgi:glycosyltransferase involved in cell wall biosynthesis
MRVSGFTILRNGVKFGYPFKESIRSLLPLVDEMIVAVGDSEDDTREQILALDSPKVRVIDTVWDMSKREGGLVLSEQTNVALAECDGDWCFYLQADEVLHEQDYGRIRARMRRYLNRPRVEGLWFGYRHFRGDYDIRDTLGYLREVRIVRNGVGIRSRGDACGFWRDGHRPLRARVDGGGRRVGAYVYHYGGVRPPRQQALRTAAFRRLYDDGELGEVPPDEQVNDWVYDYRGCVAYHGGHPAVMAQRIAAVDWHRPPFNPKPRLLDGYWWRTRLKKAGLVPGNWSDHADPTSGAEPRENM